MTNEEKIKKWLAGELSDSERKEFESTEEFAQLSKLFKAAKNFKAPEFDVEGEYSRLHKKLSRKKRTIPIYMRGGPVLKIAAILVLGLVLGYFSYTYFTTTPDKEEWIAEQKEVYLPDSSIVSLNKGSKIKFSDKKWDKVREVELVGEAFFSVKTGVQFNVVTQQGRVSVLGTEFTVKDRDNFYQVSCFSGSVKVDAKQNSVLLKPNSTFRIINDNPETYSFINKPGPDWLRGESNFKSVPLEFVINELERQFNLSVETRNLDLTQLFTGGFSHQNMEIALKSITLPLNLHYEINEEKIVITVEGK